MMHSYINQTGFKGATHCIVMSSEGRPLTRWLTNTEQELILPHPFGVYEFLLSHYKRHGFDFESITISTEYQCAQHHVQCHPFYQGENPHFDWVYMNFDKGTIGRTNYSAGLYPCKVLAVVTTEKNKFLAQTELVVLSASAHDEKQDSVLFEAWTLMEEYLCVPVESIHSSVFVLERGKGRISCCLDPSQWPSKFTNAEDYESVTRV